MSFRSLMHLFADYPILLMKQNEFLKYTVGVHIESQILVYILNFRLFQKYTIIDMMQK